jgi:hypothetical protein
LVAVRVGAVRLGGYGIISNSVSLT